MALVTALLMPGVAPAHEVVESGMAKNLRLISPIEVNQPVAAKAAATAPEPPLVPTPRAKCGPGAWPETGIQGRVSREDHEKGLAARGFRCNTELVGSLTKEPPNLGTVGGYKVQRYVDRKGNECAYYDTSLLPPSNAPDLTMGVRVVDMANPAQPRLSTILTTPAMVSPHESLVLNEKRGVLAAVAGNLGQAVLPGIVDLYDLSEDCLNPTLKSSTPTGVYGHESGMAPDGKTFYSASFTTGTIVAVDITNLSLPVPIWFGRYKSHGLSLSDDGTRAYLTLGRLGGMTILDTTQVQNRIPDPQVPEVSSLTWKGISIPQNTVPITVKGHPYVVESDEFGAQVKTGGARIIDIEDEAHPKVISNMRLEVMQPENFDAQAGDPGVDTPFRFAQGYTGHFCNVPTRVDPPIVACGMAVSGLRIFDIRDPYQPKEIAYYNAPVKPRTFPEGSNWAYSQPAFAPERKEVWYSDAFTGFYAVKLTNGAWPDAQGTQASGQTPAAGQGPGAPGTAPALLQRPCTSTRGPRTSYQRGGATFAKRRRLRFRGTARGARCGGGLKRIEVALARRSRSGPEGSDGTRRQTCRFVNRRGRLGRPSSCTRRRYIAARGTTRWGYRLRRPLPRGHYKIWARGVTHSRFVEPVSRRNVRTFKVR